MLRRATLVLALLPVLPARGQAPPLFTGLGTHHYDITTHVPRAQEYFDQGLRLTYAFNHEEAANSFREAARLDPACAMCQWGIALALGPNINAPMPPEQERAAHAAIRAAEARAGTATRVERALIAALGVRYGADGDPARRAARDSAYAHAMADVVRAHPADLEAATLHAEAVMDLSPWNYWTPAGEPRPGTAALVRELEGVIRRDPRHPGACHFFIHAVEAAQPQKAVACAERLAALMPAAGHLVHMPAHIYIRVGRYADAAAHNEHAIHADEVYLEGRRPQGVYPIGYYPHNIHFLWAVQSIRGRYADALRDADRVLERVPLEVVRQIPPFEVYRPLRLYTFARFGRWAEVLREPHPAAELAFTTGIWHHARGLAFAATGRLPEARAELDSLRTIRAATPADRMINLNSAQTLLEIAERVLAGEIAAHAGENAAAVEHLRAAARLEDGLTYDEPPAWYAPVRHRLGAVLLHAGRPAEAEQAFREDLRKFPANGWALRGLEEALRAQGRTAEANAAAVEFRRAWAGADAPPPVPAHH